MQKLSSHVEAVLWSLAMVTVGALCSTVYNRRRKNSKFSIPSSSISRSIYRKELEVAIQLALEAGSNMRGYCDCKGTENERNYDLAEETKGRPEDFFTVVDVQNENLITEGILKAFPSHVIIGEESTGTGDIPKLTKHPTWIIDPIDGTTNFASGLPLTCVSIGYCVDGTPVLGVAYAPMTDELFIAIKGHGAYRNGVQLIPRTPRALRDSVVCCEFGYSRDHSEVDAMTLAVNKVMRHGCRTLRMIGSGVLDLCYVGSGRLDVVYAGVANEGWKPWDYCAGMVIANEAGCAIEAIDQDKDREGFDLYSKSIICANSQNLLQEVRQVITSRPMKPEATHS